MSDGRLTGRRVLGVFAHPDDETYTMAGCMARYSAEGATITMLTFTRGEAGQIGGGSDATKETLGAVREAELRAACEIAGCTDVRVVGTPDGATQETDEGVGAIVDVLRELEPDVVITMEPMGITRHPDHIAVSAMVSRAVEQTRDSGYPRKLYLTAFPDAAMQAFVNLLQERGIKWISPDDPLYPQASPDQSVAAIVDVTPWIETKRTALKAHVTQSDEMVSWLPEDLFAFVFGAESFQRPYPPRAPGEAPEEDLFEGIG